MNKIKVSSKLLTSRKNWYEWVVDFLDVLTLNKIAYTINKKFDPRKLEQELYDQYFGSKQQASFKPLS